MCLENARIIESEKDIVCYKVAYSRGDGCYMSPYHNYEFSLGKSAHTASIKKRNTALLTIEGEVFN